MPALLDRDGRVGHHPFQPPDQLALLDREFTADAHGPDAVHEVHCLALLEAEEGLYVPSAENGMGFGRPRLGQDSLKLMDIGRVV